MTRTVLVTGAAGFVGAHLLAHLRSTGAAGIIGFDRRAPTITSWDGFVTGDMTGRDQVSRLLRDFRPDEIYHLAAIIRGSESDLEAVNIRGTRNLLEATARHCPEAALIVVGSAAEYGRAAACGRPLTEDDRCEPIDGYGRSKYAAVLETLAAAQAGLRANVVRPFNLVGAGVPDSFVVGAVISRLSALAADGGGELRMGNVDSLRDFVDVGDVVEGMVRVARSGLAGRLLNLCSGQTRSVRDLVTQLARIADLDVEVVQDRALVRADDIPISVGSHAAATAAVGFRPTTPLSDSLRNAWVAANGGTAPA